MKKQIRIFFTAAAMGCLLSFPAWAAETRAEYKEEVAPVKEELRALEAELKPLREENKAAAARYKSVRLSKKETGSLSVSKDTWKKAKELHKQITAIRKDMGKSNVKNLRLQAKAALKEKDFDTALHNMNQILEEKKARQDSAKEIHEIWQQIDALLQEG